MSPEKQIEDAKLVLPEATIRVSGHDEIVDRLQRMIIEAEKEIQRLRKNIEDLRQRYLKALRYNTTKQGE